MKQKGTSVSLFGKFKSIQSAMMASFSLLIIFAGLTFLLIAVNYTNKAIYENSIHYTTQIIRQVNRDIDAYIDYMENISSVIAKSSDVSRYLFDENQTQEQYAEERERILTQFHTIMESRSDIYNIAIVADNGKYIVNSGTDKLTEYIDIKSLDWYQKTMQASGAIVVSSSHVQNAIQSSYQWVITLSRALVNNQTGKKEGLFFVDLNYSAISNLCNSNHIGNKGYIFLVDANGNVIYHPKQQLLYGGLLTEKIDDVMRCDSDYFFTDQGAQRRLYTISRSEKTGWYAVGVAYSFELLKNTKQAQAMYLLVAAGLLLGVLVLSNRLSQDLTRPIRQLRDCMSTVEEGNFEASVDIAVANEIGSLSRSFNMMTDRIRALIEQNRYEQEQKRKSELRALQSQINPHFLYNTLDSIIWMAEDEKNEEVVVMTAALARLLRQSISNEQEQVTVAQEIDYVRSYLTIQKMRYKDKLEYEIEASSEVLPVSIVKFTLQPLVENAIYHGIKYKETKGKVRVRGFVEENKAFLAVEDDGAGMDEQQMRKILDEAGKEQAAHIRTGRGVGVSNVLKRLRLYYGEEYGISYTSKIGVGTCALVSIPLSGGKNEKVDEKPGK